MKIVWGITGAGDLLPEVIDELEKLHQTGLEMTAYLSKAAYMVVGWYKLRDRIARISKRVYLEHDANTPFVAGALQLGKYRSMLVAPATANTVAKIVHGIADTLITNAVAQALKGSVSVFILPVDQKAGEKVTILPTGEEKTLIMRDIDIENVEKLKCMKGIYVLETPQQISTLTRRC